MERREAFVSDESLDRLKRLVADSGITKYPNSGSFVSRIPDSHQELEITYGGASVLLSPTPAESDGAAKKENDAEEKKGNQADNFYAIVNDIKCLFFSLVCPADHKIETF